MSLPKGSFVQHKSYLLLCSWVGWPLLRSLFPSQHTGVWTESAAVLSESPFICLIFPSKSTSPSFLSMFAQGPSTMLTPWNSPQIALHVLPWSQTLILQHVYILCNHFEQLLQSSRERAPTDLMKNHLQFYSMLLKRFLDPDTLFVGQSRSSALWALLSLPPLSPILIQQRLKSLSFFFIALSLRALRSISLLVFPVWSLRPHVSS